MPNADKHFTMTPDVYGGVRLRLRHKFRDEGHDITELDNDGIARSRYDNEGNTGNNKGAGKSSMWSDDDLPGSTTPTNENGGNPTEQIIHVFAVPPGQRAELRTQQNGTIALVLVSSPDELLGNSTINNAGKIDTTLNNQGPTTRDSYVARSYGRNSASAKLAQINAANRATFKR